MQYIGDKLTTITSGLVEWASSKASNVDGTDAQGKQYDVIHVFDAGNYFLSDKYIKSSTGLYNNQTSLAYINDNLKTNSNVRPFTIYSTDGNGMLEVHTDGDTTPHNPNIPLVTLRDSDAPSNKLAAYALKDATGISYVARFLFDGVYESSTAPDDVESTLESANYQLIKYFKLTCEADLDYTHKDKPIGIHKEIVDISEVPFDLEINIR